MRRIVDHFLLYSNYFLLYSILYVDLVYSFENRRKIILVSKKWMFRNKVQQIRKFADLNNLLDLSTFRKCGTLRICDL
jgi:hypothetical protein